MAKWLKVKISRLSQTNCHSTLYRTTLNFAAVILYVCTNVVHFFPCFSYLTITKIFQFDTFLVLHLMGQCHEIFSTFFEEKKIDWTVKNSFVNVFVFAKMSVRNMCLRSQRLHWHGVRSETQSRWKKILERV